VDRFAAQRDAMTRAILDGEGATTAAERRAAYDGSGAAGAVADYVETVAAHAYRTTDEQVAALRAAGKDDPQIFELTVATAVGKSTRQLASALAALAEATATPTAAGEPR
jgi:alkylhydroperoxidase family enzyme